jgi:hypothetical protein
LFGILSAEDTRSFRIFLTVHKELKSAESCCCCGFQPMKEEQNSGRSAAELLLLRKALATGKPQSSIVHQTESPSLR